MYRTMYIIALLFLLLSLQYVIGNIVIFTNSSSKTVDNRDLVLAVLGSYDYDDDGIYELFVFDEPRDYPTYALYIYGTDGAEILIDLSGLFTPGNVQSYKQGPQLYYCIDGSLIYMGALIVYSDWGVTDVSIRIVTMNLLSGDIVYDHVYSLGYYNLSWRPPQYGQQTAIRMYIVRVNDYPYLYIPVIVPGTRRDVIIHLIIDPILSKIVYKRSIYTSRGVSSAASIAHFNTGGFISYAPFTHGDTYYFVEADGLLVEFNGSVNSKWYIVRGVDSSGYIIYYTYYRERILFIYENISGDDRIYGLYVYSFVDNSTQYVCNISNTLPLISTTDPMVYRGYMTYRTGVNNLSLFVFINPLLDNTSFTMNETIPMLGFFQPMEGTRYFVDVYGYSLLIVDPENGLIGSIPLDIPDNIRIGKDLKEPDSFFPIWFSPAKSDGSMFYIVFENGNATIFPVVVVKTQPHSSWETRLIPLDEPKYIALILFIALLAILHRLKSRTNR